MASLDNCFVDTVAVPLQLIDVGAPFRAAEEGREPASQSYHIRFSGLPELASHLETVKQTDYTCRYISICQRTSWRPLQATKPMLDLIVSQHDIGPSFWEIPSCFYTRNLELEQVHCVPYTESRRGPFIEISYTLKYPEYKPNDDKWVVRQSGVYHRFNTVTSQSTYVLFSPTPNSKAHQRAEEYLLGHRDDAEAEPFWLHRILFSTYYPAWRQHIAALESQFLPIANKTFATFIDKPLGIGYDNLSELISLEKQFLQMPIILASSIDSLRELDVLVGSLPATPASRDTVCELRNLHRQSVSFSRMATHLQQRAQITAQLLSDTLSLRDQGVAKQQNENMLRLNKSAVFITTLTLLYLPASFVASFFGSNFWALDTDSGTIVGTPMIWIFVISSASLTALTFIFYYWLLQRDGSVFRRLQPKISMRIPPDWNFKGLTRRFTNAKDGDNLFEMSKA